MFKDVNLNQNNNISYDDTRIKSSNIVPSFKATNPNAVDTTPTADTYTPQTQQPQGQNPQAQMGTPPPQEDPGSDMLTTYVKYGLPAGAALYAGTELFNKVNTGDYEKSLLGRMGKFGDRISESSLINNKYVRGMANSAGTLKSKTIDFIKRHPRLNAMYETPTAPENSFVKGFLETQKEYDLTKGAGALLKRKSFFNKESGFLLKNPKTLLSAGATKAEIEALKAKYETNALGRIKNQEAAVQEFLIDKLGKENGHGNIIQKIESTENNLRRLIDQKRVLLQTQATTPESQARISNEIASHERTLANLRKNVLDGLKYKHIGIKKSEIDKIIETPLKYADKIEQALLKASKFSPKCSLAYNNIRSGIAPVSKLGRFLPKITKLGLRGLTFGGGRANCLFVLPLFLGMAIKNVFDAPKDKKVATAAHGLNDASSWVISMPLAVTSMHAVNGLKNLGKTKDQVDNFETARKAFNNKVKAGLLSDKALYDAERAQLEALKNVGTKPKGFFNKVFSKLGKFMSIGLGQISPYKASTAGLSTGAKISKTMGNLKRLLPNFGRNLVGYPLRFALYMFAFQPLVDKLFTVPLNAIFGKPYDPDKEKEEAEKNGVQPAVPAAPVQNKQNDLKNIDINSLSDDNLIKQMLSNSGEIPKNQQPSQSQTGQNVPQQMNNDPNVSEYDTVPRSFVPQIDPNNPIPFHDVQDPNVNPDYDKNYIEAKKNYDKTERLIADVQAFIDEGKQ